MTASTQVVAETTTTTTAAAATTATATTATAAPATTPSTPNIATNDADASSLQAVADLATTFPLPSMDTAGPALDSGAVITVDDLTEEEENQTDRSRY